ncbi:MAG: tRNA (adenosine(37)-N6)-threonylcarbamoyltransferase complex transferase subunit TsaD [Alphaproteobacteria bacterium]|nr:tRNA (adenosine(37)-N6)-threonylcarbamoyltransferase complex transferase subunit TsaD [Alphaproteobacteria bacterium]
MIVLGIESSCDETAIAIIKDKEILSHIVLSQIDAHKAFGGVIPEVASRMHLEAVDGLINAAVKEAKLNLRDIDVFVATAGPGLAGGLIIGSLAAKTLSLVFNKPFVAVNHLQGHALMPTMNEDVKFPFLLLLVSGGHTQFLAVNGINDYKILGASIDDAIGEAFDKSARLLGLSYPGGREIELLAADGDENRFKFPLPLCNQKNCNFSFSGLKTAVREEVFGKELSEQDKKDIAASLQHTIVKILLNRTQNAINMFEKDYGRLNQMVISGGVSANLKIRAALGDFLKTKNISLVCPPLNLCTDNGLMIAWAGYLMARENLFNSLDFPIKVRWSLEELKNAVLASKK